MVRLTEEDVVVRARELLRRCRREGEADPVVALRRLRRRARLYQLAFARAGELHQRLAELIYDLRERSGQVSGGLPSWSDVPWEVSAPFGALLERAPGAEVLCLVSSEAGLEGDPVSEADALCTFAEDPRIVLVEVGQAPPLLIRASFLLQAAARVPASTSFLELPRGLAEAAGRLGLEARSV